MRSKDIARAAEPAKKRKRMSARKRALVCVTVIVLVAMFILAFNSLLVISNPNFIMTFGTYRLFPVLDDHLEPEISVGSMIAANRPTIPEAIKSDAEGADGSIIVFRLKNGEDAVVSIGRVVEVSRDGNDYKYTVNMSKNGYAPTTCVFSDIVGVYTGKKAGFFGWFFSFLNSPIGLILLLLLMGMILLAWWLWHYINSVTVRRKLVSAALEKSAQALSNVGLRYDNIHEITAVMDVLSMLTETPKTKAESAEITARLNAFVKAENITLPQTPETAAILDSLPAPDTPGSLAAALASGATLRQAEDGQTLVLTTISGGKNILLTPVQTADGIILCQQGTRIKSDLAPNIEDIGFMSMPASPEFFEGQPLEKNVEYPELPQPTRLFSHDQIGRAEASEPSQSVLPGPQLSAPRPTGSAEYALLPDHLLPQGSSISNSQDDVPRVQTIEAALQPEKSYGMPEQTTAPENAVPPVVTNPERSYPTDAAAFDNAPTPVAQQKSRPSTADDRPQAEQAVTPPASRTEPKPRKNAYLQYRAASADAERAVAEQLHTLLDDMPPLTDEEKRKVDEYRAARKKPSKPKKENAVDDEAKQAKKQAAKLAAEKKKAEQAAFLSTLTDEEREVYLAEQKLKKSREAAVRKLKKIAADRKLLNKIDTD